jgi:virginiamycin B lyase
MRSLTLLLLMLGLAPQGFAADVQVYTVPEGAHPHDVAPAPDGKVWYTAQHQGALGILDPVSRRIEQVALGAGSRPHGVIPGPDGAAWITDGGLNAIVRYDPKSGEVKRFPLPPDSGYANLNTAAFDAAGILWFTGQSGIYGRLSPASGELQVFPAPGGRGPYGIAATPGGEIYYASLAGSHIAHVDSATGEATRIEPPTPGQGARRVWADSAGDVWVSEWNSGQLSRYRPATGDWKSWKLPGTDPRAYAVYVDENDDIWVSDFGGNALLQFDVDSERFVVFPGSGPDASVRQIHGRPGEIWAPESGLDRLLVIRTDAP